MAATLGMLILAASATAFLATMRTVGSVSVSTTSDRGRPGGDGGRDPHAARRVQAEVGDVRRAGRGANRVQFWALLNRTGSASLAEPLPTLVEYQYTGGCLTESQTFGGITRTKCLVRTTVAPSFTYYTSGALAVGGVPVTPMPTSTPVAAVSLPDIRSVEVQLTVLPTGVPAGGALPVISRVTFENLAAAGG